jgi:RNA:NAD 2'-phosphotransferase (TPT1/KptA family)
VHTSKQLSWLLRHGAPEKNLKVDDRGFAFVEDVVRVNTSFYARYLP